MNFLSGFIAIVGPTNVGKSTLMNYILGTKAAIVSPKPQTTRNRIMGIYHGEGLQMVFMDTPGIHKPGSALSKSMVSSALATLQEVDIILLMIEMGHPDNPEISTVLRNLKGRAELPCILLINKIDLGSRDHLLPIIDKFRQKYPFDAIIPISALKGDGIEALFAELKSKLKPGPQFFPDDMKTDRPESFLVSEVIREKIYSHTKKELPYSSAVTTETIEDIPKKKLISIVAGIHVETDSQKGILVGRQGRMIKAIGTSARMELEKIFGVQVYLNLTVRVEKNWTKNTKALKRLGY